MPAAFQDPCADLGSAWREHPGYRRRRPEQQAGRRQHHQYSFWHSHACSLPCCAGTHRHPLGALPCHLCRGLLLGVQVRGHECRGFFSAGCWWWKGLGLLAVTAVCLWWKCSRCSSWLLTRLPVFMSSDSSLVVLDAKMCLGVELFHFLFCLCAAWALTAMMRVVCPAARTTSHWQLCPFWQHLLHSTRRLWLLSSSEPTRSLPIL